MRRHIIILIGLSLLLRGWLFTSYPFGVGDDNQAAQQYLIEEILSGNLQIGNVRYQTGYPLVIAPVAALAAQVDALDDRILLLVQVAVSALIPFLIYDIVRRWRSEREAFIVALFVLFDPLGLQMPHFMLPEWWVAFGIVFGLWCITRARTSPRPMIWFIAAGVVMGLGGIARLNILPLVALIGVLVLIQRQQPLRWRIQGFAAIGVFSAAILGLYMVLIHYPSTGTWQPSCISGVSLYESLGDKNLTISAANGSASAAFLDVTARLVPREIIFTQDTYPLWRQIEPWGTPDELAVFEAGTATQGYPLNVYSLSYYLGPCEADRLTRAMFWETVRAQPLTYAAGTLVSTLKVLMQIPQFEPSILLLPSIDQVEPVGTPRFAGFQRVEGGYYTGQWVWLPGIQWFSALAATWNLIKLLTPIALIWALLSKNWWYFTCALVLLANAFLLSAVDVPEARIYAAMYPLWMVIIGGLFSRLLHRFIERQQQRVPTH